LPIAIFDHFYTSLLHLRCGGGGWIGSLLRHRHPAWCSRSVSLIHHNFQTFRYIFCDLCVFTSILSILKVYLLYVKIPVTFMRSRWLVFVYKPCLYMRTNICIGICICSWLVIQRFTYYSLSYFTILRIFTVSWNNLW